MKHWLATIAVLLCSLTASAKKVEIDGIWYNLVSKAKQAEVTYTSYNSYYNEYSGSITLPATVTYDGVGYSVTSIGNEAFRNCSLTAITIPEGVTSIGWSAFRNCSLTSITLPEGVTSIGESAFSDCSSLTAINIPENSQLTSIGESAFQYCSSLTAINIPEGVTSIGDYAFSRCSSLTAINIPENSKLTSIGENAFYGCSSLTSITLPESVTSIGDGAFEGCSSLTAINIPESVTSIGSSAFYGCSSLTAVHISSIEAWCKISFDGSTSNPLACAQNLYLNGELVTELVIPEGVTSIGDYVFSGCSSLTAITIPEGVTSIGSSAFRDCSSLTDITLPESVTSIGSSAFVSCSSLTAINIPESVTSIKYGAFYGCSSLTAINIPENVTSIGSSAFVSCSSLTAINIPEGVTSIGDAAFLNCSSLTAINIPESVTSIGYDVFGCCSSLTAIIVEEGNEVYDSRNGCNAIIETNSNTLVQGCSTTIIPESVTSIGDRAFYGCSSLTAINIPEGVTSIGKYAFEDCSNLTAINIPEGVTSIGWCAFRNCSLTSITLPEGVTSIGNDAFEDCSNLTAVYISSIEAWCKISFDSYYSNPLYYAHNLYLNGELVTELVIPEGVTSIGKYAFFGCSSLTAITIPEGVTSIGQLAFMYCSSFTSITIPEGVTSIGYQAFYGCSSLTAITCHAVTPPTVDTSYAFYGVDKSIPVYVPEGSVEDYKAAKYWKDFTNITALTPTEVSITINQYGSGTYCSEYALDFSNVEGLKAYAATGYNSRTGVVTLTRVMTTQPGVGLFIKGNQGKYVVPIMESTDDHTTNMLVGTLTETAVNATSGDGLYANYKYTIKEGESQPLFYQFTDGSTLGAGKAYLQIPMAWLPQTSETKSISLRFEEGEGTTDIENSQFTIDNSQLTYDLYGRRVDNPVKGGIYIVGGHKVVY